MQILYGYLATYAYVGFVIFLLCYVLGNKIGKENSRKFLHLFMFVIWYFVDVFLKGTIHQVILPATVIVFNYVEYRFKLIKNLQRDNEEKSPGTVYFAISITIVYLISYFIPDMYPMTGISVIALALGDGMAAIIGKKIKSKKIYNNKSISGSIACFLATFIGCVAYKYLFFAELDYVSIILISTTATIIELIGFGLDNLSVPLCTFVIGYGLFKLGIDFKLALIYGTILFLLVFCFKLINYFGSLISGFVFSFFYYFGGYRCLLFLVGCYLLMVITHIIRKILKAKDEVVKKSKEKDVIQVLANATTGIIGMFIFALSKDLKYQIIAIICICACFVDTISSDIGTLSKKDPYDIFKRKKVVKGVSGGMSVLGTSISFVVSFLMGLSITFAFNLKAIYMLIVTLVIFAGTFFDSFLGSLLQVKYECVVCGKITEKEEHCNCLCKQIEGYKFFNNDTVNFLSSVFVFLVSMLALI